MENILWGIIYLMCFAMGIISISFGFRYLKICKKSDKTKHSKEILTLFILVILCGVGFIVLPILNMLGVLS